MSAKLIVSATVFLMFAAAGIGEEQSESGIEGTISISPTRAGPIKPDTPPSMPLANTSFVAQADDGAQTSFETDRDGRFRVVLPPGHYTISRKGPRPAIGNFGPFSVEVVTGKMTKVEWECDSGVR